MSSQINPKFKRTKTSILNLTSKFDKATIMNLNIKVPSCREQKNFPTQNDIKNKYNIESITNRVKSALSKRPESQTNSSVSARSQRFLFKKLSENKTANTESSVKIKAKQRSISTKINFEDNSLLKESFFIKIIEEKNKQIDLLNQELAVLKRNYYKNLNSRTIESRHASVVTFSKDMNGMSSKSSRDFKYRNNSNNYNNNNGNGNSKPIITKNKSSMITLSFFEKKNNKIKLSDKANINFENYNFHSDSLKPTTRHKPAKSISKTQTISISLSNTVQGNKKPNKKPIPKKNFEIELKETEARFNSLKNNIRNLFEKYCEFTEKEVDSEIR